MYFFQLFAILYSEVIFCIPCLLYLKQQLLLLLLYLTELFFFFFVMNGKVLSWSHFGCDKLRTLGNPFISTDIDHFIKHDCIVAKD